MNEHELQVMRELLDFAEARELAARTAVSLLQDLLEAEKAGCDYDDCDQDADIKMHDRTYRCRYHAVVSLLADMDAEDATLAINEGNGSLLGPKLTSQAMEERLQRGEAIDITKVGIKFPDGSYQLATYSGSDDFCIPSTGKWIWSIGRRLSDGKIFAAPDDRFYQNSDFECIYLR